MRKFRGLSTRLFPASLYLFLPVAAIALLGGCAQTHYYPYVGANTQLGKGGGGERIINGIEVWSDGLPTRRYTIIGVVHDHRSGIFHATLLKDITKQAKKMGGQGILEYKAYATAMSSFAASASGFGSNADQLPQAYGPTASSWLAFAGPASAGLGGGFAGTSRWWVFRYQDSSSKSKKATPPNTRPAKDQHQGSVHSS
ncbi:hypothetical protein [Methylacidimicrobium tartarophylax]|uniref:Lipoprotein n=1 Tax=Methylacidimicrobium tartarophylax TaxID=1041768 RepID=A0A5E6MID1_9BACT|nr:hypothetical protein [Methylacidimicrobium tartarophylax]VVM05806.1 hypothetical protein MAMT_00807 [Methylacidimicrobium tartarophylax]